MGGWEAGLLLNESNFLQSSNVLNPSQSTRDVCGGCGGVGVGPGREGRLLLNRKVVFFSNHFNERIEPLCRSVLKTC